MSSQFPNSFPVNSLLMKLPTLVPRREEEIDLHTHVHYSAVAFGVRHCGLPQCDTFCCFLFESINYIRIYLHTAIS